MVHCFGLTSSPSVAGYAFRRTAEENLPVVLDKAVQVVFGNIYVDDMLVSMPDSEGAIGLVEELDSLLKSGGFKLAKFSSNCSKVLAALPADRLALQLSEVHSHGEDSPGQNILGLVWHPESDVLGVKETPPWPVFIHVEVYCLR